MLCTRHKRKNLETSPALPVRILDPRKSSENEMRRRWHKTVTLDRSNISAWTSLWHIQVKQANIFRTRRKVSDRFHVIKIMNEAIANARWEECKTNNPPIKPCLSGWRILITYLWKEKKKLNSIKNLYKRTAQSTHPRCPIMNIPTTTINPAQI